ncbi:hypothetical protein AKJ08_0225 [Vulgatibacter incomptus]|uniref:Uncharacterized protein n=1 Tax=Vulgatibacter incomptus TaxID=1391653 RepID=A0A0K1P8I0_9BACT|nr:hypothetical protein AKJ08_0225 [Vulgatibacter incomptus]
MDVPKDELWVGDCGELAWPDPTSEALQFVGVDGAPREVAVRGSPLWLGGGKLLYTTGRKVELVDSGTDVKSWPVVGASRGGPVPGTDSFWTCTNGRGIERLDEDGATALTPDFFGGNRGYLGCVTADVSRSGAIAYATDAYRIGLVDVVTGGRSTLDPAFFPGGADEEGLERADAVRISPDGALVLHEKRWQEREFDYVVEVGEGQISMVKAGASQPVQIPGAALADARGFGGVGPGWIWLGPWMGTAPGVFLPGAYGGSAHLVGLGEPIPFENLIPRAIRGNHLFVQTASGAGLLELGDGALHDLMDAPTIESVVPFRWGGPVAISSFTGDCIRLPEPPGYCHTQLWSLSLWDAERGARQVALGTQPLHVHAIGPDGQMIVAGPILDEAPPEFGEPRDAEWRTLLLGADGRPIRELDRDAWIKSGLGGEHFAVLQRERRTDRVRTEELVTVDWTTGEETLLVAGPYITSWGLDHSDRRVTALVDVIVGNERPRRELWSGVVPR